jgi:hypothetical protein
VIIIKGRAKTKPLKADVETKPAVSLKDVLGEFFDAYWETAKFFGEGKNYRPIESAAIFMGHVSAGVDTSVIKRRAARARAQIDDPKYLPQFSKWLSGQDFSIVAAYPEGTTNEPTSRLSGRTHAT